jgi:hypothetical protein
MVRGLLAWSYGSNKANGRLWAKECVGCLKMSWEKPDIRVKKFKGGTIRLVFDHHTTFPKMLETTANACGYDVTLSRYPFFELKKRKQLKKKGGQPWQHSQQEYGQTMEKEMKPWNVLKRGWV